MARSLSRRRLLQWTGAAAALALFGPDGAAPHSIYPATFFHLGRYFGTSVKMHVLSDGAAREVLYSPDNIVAFWVPRAPARAGNRYSLSYRLHWLAEEPYPATALARAVATRLGRGGEPGRPRAPGVVKFVVEFDGDGVAALSQPPQPKFTASRGTVTRAFAEPVPGARRWRAVFDIATQGEEPVELRLYLALAERALSETWLYQFRPAAARPS